jgi:hypothetical protein
MIVDICLLFYTTFKFKQLVGWCIQTDERKTPLHAKQIHITKHKQSNLYTLHTHGLLYLYTTITTDTNTLTLNIHQTAAVSDNTTLIY